MLCTLTLITSSQENKFSLLLTPWNQTGAHVSSNNAHTGENMHKAAMPNYALSSHWSR